MPNLDSSYGLLPDLIAQMNAMKPFTKREIQSLYDECMEGTNQELVYYLLSVVRILATQNEGIPEYIENAIKEYITSGEIEKVLAEVLAGYMLNVKNPPEGLTPAVGDGTANDTEAIQGCIDYAYENGGMAVYFPSGAYLCSSLTLQDTTTLFGQDRYTTRIVLQGGATSPLLSGTAEKLTLSGIGLDGNGDVQVNNVNLVDVTVENAIIINALLTDGFDLLKMVVNNDVQISGVMLDHAINNALVMSGDGVVNAENVTFGSISTLVGEYYIDSSVSNSKFTGLNFVGQATKYIKVTGNNNIFSGTCSHSPMPQPDDSGNNNSFDFWGSFVTEKYLGDIEKTGASGDYSYTGNYSKTVGGTSTENIVGNSSFNSGNRTEIYDGTHSETNDGKTVTSSGDITESCVNRTETVSGKYTQTSGSEEKNVTGASVENTGDKTVTVDGNKTETVDGDCSQTVTGNSSRNVGGNETLEITGSVTETATKRTENLTDFDMNTVNPMQYKNPTEVPDCEYFDYVPMKDRNGAEYRVLVENENTPLLEGVVTDKYIIIGDSYAGGYTAGGNVTGFPAVMAQMEGWTLNEDYWHNEVGGAGFASTGAVDGVQRNFQALLEVVLGGMTTVQKSAVKYVLFAGGWNDRTFSINQITQNMELCMDYVRANLPNAKIFVAHIGWSRQQNYRSDIVENSIPAYQQAGKYGATYITNSEFSLHDYGWISTVDNQHPLQDGQDNIARCMLEGFEHGICNNIYALQTLDVSLADNMLSSNPGFGAAIVENGITTWAPGRITMYFVGGKTISGGDPITLGTLTAGIVQGWSENTNSFFGNASGYVQFGSGASTFHQFQGGLSIANGKLQLTINKLVEGGGGFETFDNIYAIRIDVDTITCNSLLT